MSADKSILVGKEPRRRKLGTSGRGGGAGDAIAAAGNHGAPRPCQDPSLLLPGAELSPIPPSDAV